MQSFDKILPLIMEEIMGKIQDGRQWPYLLMGLNQVQAGITRTF